MQGAASYGHARGGNQGQHWQGHVQAPQPGMHASTALVALPQGRRSSAALLASPAGGAAGLGASSRGGLGALSPSDRLGSGSRSQAGAATPGASGDKDRDRGKDSGRPSGGHGGGDDGESSSRGSGSHASFSSSMRKLLARLRRQLGEDDSDLLPALRWLRAAGIAVMMLSFALAIATVAVSTARFRAYSADLATASQASDLMEANLRVGASVREMVLLNRGWTGYGSPAAIQSVDLPLLHGELVSQTARFASLLDALTTDAAAAGWGAMYATPVETLQFSINSVSGRLEATTHVVSLQEACREFVAEAKATAALPLTDVSDSLPPVRYVELSTQRTSPLHVALNATLLEWTSNSVASKDFVLTFLRAVYGAISAAVIILAVCVFGPILLYVDASKDAVVRSFVALPKRVLDRLRESSEAQLRRATLRDAEDDDADLDSDSDDDADSRGVADDAAGDRGDRAGGAGGDGEDDVERALLASGHGTGTGDGVGVVTVTEAAGGAAAAGIAAAAVTGAGGQSRLRDHHHGNNGGRAGSVAQDSDTDWYALLSPASSAGADRDATGIGMHMHTSRDSSRRFTGAGAESRRFGSAAVAPAPSGAGTPSGPGGAGAIGTSKSRLPSASRPALATRSAYTASTARIGNGGGGGLRSGSSMVTSTGEEHRYTKSIWPLLVLLLKYVGPLILIFAFFTCLYFVSVSVLDQTLTTSATALAAKQRGLMSIDLSMQTRAIIASGGTPADVQPGVVAASTASADLDYLHRLLTFGGVPTSPAFAAVSPAVAEGDVLPHSAAAIASAALYGDACSTLWIADSAAFPASANGFVGLDALGLLPDGSAPEGYAGSVASVGANVSDCRRLMSGALARGGLHAALRELQRLSADFLLRRACASVPAWDVAVPALGVTAPSGDGNVTTLGASGGLTGASIAGGANYSVPRWNATAASYLLATELHAEGLRAVREVGGRYLPRASFVLAAQYSEAGQASISWFITFQISFVATFLV